jgi:phosphoesterase RecJ-like protein
VLFSLDYNSPSRINDASGSFVNSPAVKILIDHHINPEKDAYDHCFSTTQISSTCELVYQFMKSINKNLIDKAIAENIFVGIMTDTGSFSYNCNYESTFKIVAELIGKKIDTNRINRLIYSDNTESRLKLLGYSLSEKLIVLPEYQTAYISLTRAELEKYHYKTGDTEGLVNYALSIKGVQFAALFTERENKIRISFRSVGNFSVNEFAGKHYEGGGHRNAAGGDSFVDMDQTLINFNRLLEDYKDLLK